MRPPSHYSASPLYSFCTTPTEHVLPFGVTLRQIIAWLRGVGPDWKQASKEAKVVDEMAALMAAEAEDDDADKVEG